MTLSIINSPYQCIYPNNDPTFGLRNRRFYNNLYASSTKSQSTSDRLVRHPTSKQAYANSCTNTLHTILRRPLEGPLILSEG